ncbi:toxin VasX [Stutzerimonas nitrititolerans]|uniref:toxin VasX n=1 Tax=Stutzerimonas nitrititolerans TaxID=2482751 RepID=UPI0028A67A88|nr:toxin VasX [Stutzerimonas nitrititolerans]
MTAQTPPRNNANLAAKAASCDDSRSATSTCPLMKAEVQLIPLRYGLTEWVDPASDLPMPFTLKSRSLGIRLVRDGFLYIIDNSTGYLHEYQVEQGAITKLLWKDAEVRADTRNNAIGEPHLIFPRSSKLHVAYSELQWTARKCTQVLASREERDYFMQMVDLKQADPQQGGSHLLTRDQAEKWLAEVAQNKVHRDERGQQTYPDHQNRPALVEPHPEELQDYVWEDPPLFRDTHIGELTAKILPAHEHDALFLVLRDDIGVMRDLAQFQDKVVGWISEWREGGAQPGANERDYMIACYIESRTQISSGELSKLDDSDAQAMVDDIDKLPEPEQQQTRQALLDYVNGAPLPRPMDPTTPEPLHRAQERQFTRNQLQPANPALVERHLETIIRVKKDLSRQVSDVLNGAKLGQRGINDLIDRPAMDAFLATNRAKLQRWDALLERISTDRTAMTTELRFHRAAWYYDAQQAEQIGLAFATQYACLKDIGRSDAANEKLCAWLEESPQYDRPLFHTLPLNTQSELTAQYVLLGLSTYGAAAAIDHWLAKLREIEQGKLPALDELPEITQALGRSAQSTLDPALSFGISKAMQTFFEEVGQQKVPDLDELFRRLPKALPKRLLDAAKREGLTFVVASEAEKAALIEDLKEVLDNRAELKRLKKQRGVTISNADNRHKAPRAQALQLEIDRVRAQLDILEPRLAAAISPIAEVPQNSMRVAGAAPGRAGITLVLPPAELQEFATGLRNIRNGYSTAGTLGKLGDGVGLAVFVAQLVNLVQVFRETLSQPADKRDLMALAGAAFTTAAAGFAAAQSIANTALEARATQLVKGLQNHALTATRVQVGKLHVNLGLFAYGAGVIAAAISSRTHFNEWAGAVQSGNAQAMHGAAIALAGSSGMLGANAYGAAHTAHAYWQVRVAKTLATRQAAWALAGPRLATVFFRFNIAGALFTALELGGTWWYNRNSTDAHDEWLLSTPWSQDAEKRKDYPLGTYQQTLLGLIQRPSAAVIHGSHDSWWRDLLLSPKRIDIALAFPGLSQAELEQPLAGPPTARLSLSAYRIRTVRYEKGESMVRWHPLHELGLELAASSPLILRVERPQPMVAAIGGYTQEELLLELWIERLNERGQYREERHTIRLAPDKPGEYPASQATIEGQAAARLLIDPLLLLDAQDAANR